MQEKIYKVYIKIDNDNNIVAINSNAFIESEDIENWIYIDEGIGDKYHHAQSNYFKSPIYTDDLISRYKFLNNNIIEKTETELKKEFKPPKNQQTLAELQEQITKAQLALTEIYEKIII